MATACLIRVKLMCPLTCTSTKFVAMNQAPTTTTTLKSRPIRPIHGRHLTDHHRLWRRWIWCGRRSHRPQRSGGWQRRRLLLICADTFTLAPIALTDLIPEGGVNLENSDNITLALVTNFSGSLEQDLDTDDNGTLDATPWLGVVDAVGSVENTDTPPSGTEWSYATSLGGEDVGPDTTFAPAHIWRCPDSLAWSIGIFDPTRVSSKTPPVLATLIAMVAGSATAPRTWMATKWSASPTSWCCSPIGAEALLTSMAMASLASATARRAFRLRRLHALIRNPHRLEQSCSCH